ncbi:MAG: Fe-S cluster assembly sulfur transfer protein SufU [Bacteroidota bacterium]
MSQHDLYSEIILEHYKEPHNAGTLDNAEIEARGYNESCGDDVRVFIKVKEGRIEDIKFMGNGCAISQSSTSMMTEQLIGKSLDKAKLFIEEFKKMISGECEFPQSDEYFELSALKGVIKFPIRVKCATLAWNTVKNGILDYEAQHGQNVRNESKIQ